MRRPAARTPPPKAPPPLPPGVDVRTDPFPRMSGRRRLLIVGLAVATAFTLALILLRPTVDPSRLPSAAERAASAPDTARCTEGRAEGCVGGAVQVITPVAPR